MENYINLLSKEYDECCLCLVHKYGQAMDNYFSQASYERFKKGKIKAPAKNKITRTSEGLYLHHMDEDKQILIANSKAIKAYGISFSYQKKND